MKLSGLFLSMIAIFSLGCSKAQQSMSLNTTFDDRFPTISYAGVTEQAENDAFFNNTETALIGQVVVAWTFFGTQVFLFGALGEPNNGSFTNQTAWVIRVDNEADITVDLSSLIPFERQLLFASRVVPNGTHTIDMLNMLPGRQLLIDCFVVTSLETESMIEAVDVM
ncbi:hypothetical protein M422DRAFT_71369 [Sphaerobolus stellatus SS14]|uniref:Uncharacterized protein n=1 Tax=Sphaerobolus stellatus (strain SS14) TaxID=990650 RepID=A0A0C9U3C6_SPHS4|nr:hypothetical protein M422DRAFT_71369 [Sphaerobolus stellatus SS14]